jgi:hypothetical protein
MIEDRLNIIFFLTLLIFTASTARITDCLRRGGRVDERRGGAHPGLRRRGQTEVVVEVNDAAATGRVVGGDGHPVPVGQDKKYLWEMNG